MFLNILRVSTSISLEMLLNIAVSIGSTVVIFHSHKPTGSIDTLYLISRCPGRQERDIMTINMNDLLLKTKLHTHNTKAMLH